MLRNETFLSIEKGLVGVNFFMRESIREGRDCTVSKMLNVDKKGKVQLQST